MCVCVCVDVCGRVWTCVDVCARASASVCFIDIHHQSLP